VWAVIVVSSAGDGLSTMSANIFFNFGNYKIHDQIIGYYGFDGMIERKI